MTAADESRLELTEDQVRAFRARRGHLLGDGASNPTAAARALVGIQAQQLPPALFGLSQRTKVSTKTGERPTAEALAKKLFGSKRKLVRTWGQRDTLHIFDPKADWNRVVAARAQWSPGGRRGATPTEEALEDGLSKIRCTRDAVTRSYLMGNLPDAYVKEVADHVGKSFEPERFAAGRVMWQLANQGHLYLEDKLGNEQQYALRTDGFPDLDWEELDPFEAAAALARRYLSTYGPSTPKDIAHFFGAKVSVARTWIEALREEKKLLAVDCGDRAELWALRADKADLEAPPPPASKWPPRLLPLWDGFLMGHADKSWVLPDRREYPNVWRKAAVVAASVVARGRVVATWSHQARKDRVDVTVEPLSQWKRTFLPAVRSEAKALAHHLGVERADVAVTG
ncbi:MAG: crosslink repair DNA glycosylase YcaQ family protein [Planctomycetota bacterium]